MTFEYAGTEVTVQEGVFQPTETSKLFLDFLGKQGVLKEGALLDLGCGCGIVGLGLKRNGYGGTVQLSDVSETAVQNARENFAKYGLEVDARVGSLYEPWGDQTFDVIVDDVSGIAESIAKFSPWFGTSISCESGSDGTELTTVVIREAPLHLTPGGVLYFPVLTLSNYPRILEAAQATFEVVELVATKSFYFPADLAEKHKGIMQKAIAAKDIIVDFKFGMYIWETRIYEARHPFARGGQ